MNIYFYNDNSELNVRYRQELMLLLRGRGHNVISIGFFDSYQMFLKALFILLFSTGGIISSNIRSNILHMLFFWRRGFIVLNGMGRYRYYWLFRIFISLLIMLNVRKTFAFQNYADYRYFRRYSNASRIIFVSGSGGTRRKTGLKNNFLLIQRSTKLAMIKRSFSKFLSSSVWHSGNKVILIGCDNFHISDLPVNAVVNSIGRVEQNLIFSAGGSFLQPYGYGEGFPHTLADAICSSIDIFIDVKLYRQLGLYKIPSINAVDIGSGWRKLQLTSSVEEVSMIGVNQKYLNALISIYSV